MWNLLILKPVVEFLQQHLMLGKKKNGFYPKWGLKVLPQLNRDYMCLSARLVYCFTVSQVDDEIIHGAMRHVAAEEETSWWKSLIWVSHSIGSLNVWLNNNFLTYFYRFLGGFLTVYWIGTVLFYNNTFSEHYCSYFIVITAKDKEILFLTLL